MLLFATFQLISPVVFVDSRQIDTISFFVVVVWIALVTLFENVFTEILTVLNVYVVVEIIYM